MSNGTAYSRLRAAITAIGYNDVTLEFEDIIEQMDLALEVGDLTQKEYDRLIAHNKKVNG
jgi:hypothetical protein